MSARVVLAAAIALAAAGAGADEKVAPSAKVQSSQGSASSSGGTWTKDSSSSESRSTARPRSGSQSSSSGASERRGRSQGSDARASQPPRTVAQQRHPRPGTGTGRFDNDGYRGSRYSWGSPYYGYGYGYGYGSYGRYGSYYNPYDSWYSPYYYSGYYGYSPDYYGRSYGSSRGYRSYRDSGSLRIIVDPEKTRVYVDGYYAGVADDFDGILQRLNVPPGRHDITLKLEGHRTQHFKVYVPVDDTIKIHYDMVRGSGEATSEEFARHPEAEYGSVRDMSDEDRRRDDRYDTRDDDRYDRMGEDRDPGDTGSVRLSVNPGDASVYVDGEFRGSGRQSANLRLRPGRHRIEIVRPGFRTVEREVEVQKGRNTEIQFDLERI